MTPFFAKPLLAAGMSPEGIAVFRYSLSVLIALPFFPLGRAQRRSAVIMVLSGAAMGMGWTAYLDALKTLPVAVVGILYMTYPIFVVALAWLLARQPIRLRAVGASLLVLTAAALAHDSGGGGEVDMGALLWCLVAPATFALTIVTLTCFSADLDPLQRMATAFTGTLLWLVPVGLATNAAAMAPPSGPILLWALLMAVTTATLPQLLYASCAPFVGPSRSAVAGSLELPTMFIVGWIAFQESFDGTHVLGGALVIASILLAPPVRASTGYSAESVRKSRRTSAI